MTPLKQTARTGVMSDDSTLKLVCGMHGKITVHFCFSVFTPCLFHHQQQLAFCNAFKDGKMLL